MTEHVRVYGADHSPWVQAVLLGLEERDIPHSLVPVPPLSLLLNSGILMPAAKIGEGPWIFDSGRILRELGLGEVDAEDRRALRSVFGTGALERTASPWEFWLRWSEVRDAEGSRVRRLWNHLRRPLSVFYFFTVIMLGRIQRPETKREQRVANLLHFEHRLASGTPFLGGEIPDSVDLQLFGQVQMFASIPGPSLETLQDSPELEHLRAWVGRMQSRFAQYSHLYSGPFFDPRANAPSTAPPLERCFYWLGCAIVWAFFPLSLAFTFFYVARVTRKGLR